MQCAHHRSTFFAIFEFGGAISSSKLEKEHRNIYVNHVRHFPEETRSLIYILVFWCGMDVWSSQGYGCDRLRSMDVVVTFQTGMSVGAGGYECGRRGDEGGRRPLYHCKLSSLHSTSPTIKTKEVVLMVDIKLSLFSGFILSKVKSSVKRLMSRPY